MADLPVAVIGAGPVGLAAAANLIARGIPVKVYEAGREAGANIRSWSHVSLFSPWEFNISPAARALLAKSGWEEPDAQAYPTGGELVDRYLAPLAATPALAPVIEYGAAVTAIGRQGIDKVVSRDRDRHSFVLTVARADGPLRRDRARAVIDASGTWTSPNPIGAGGLAADGEAAFGDRIAYGSPTCSAAIARSMQAAAFSSSAPDTRPRMCCSIWRNWRRPNPEPGRSGPRAGATCPGSSAAARATGWPRAATSASA